MKTNRTVAIIGVQASFEAALRKSLIGGLTASIPASSAGFAASAALAIRTCPGQIDDSAVGSKKSSRPRQLHYTN